MERRQLLTRIWTTLGLAALAETAWVTASFLRPKSRDTSLSDMVVAGRLEQFEPGSVTAFPGPGYPMPKPSMMTRTKGE